MGSVRIFGDFVWALVLKQLKIKAFGHLYSSEPIQQMNKYTYIYIYIYMYTPSTHNAYPDVSG